MKQLFLVLSLFTFVISAYGFDHTHSAFDKILKDYVGYTKFNSHFDYKKIKATKTDHQNLLDYCKSLSQVTEAEYQKFSKNQKLAFLINAYNAFTLKHVIKHYPVESIKDIKAGFLGRIANDPWVKLKQKFRGDETSLAAIEHEMLRREFNEPRMHFTIVCASVGCPRLRNEAYTPEKLETQFKEQTKIFLTDPSKNYFKKAEMKLYVSKIFDWFRSDFKKRYGKLQNFLLPYYTSSTDEFNKLRKEKIKIKYTEYDWNLNSPEFVKE